MLSNSELTLRVLEVVGKSVEGKIEDLHIFTSDYSNFNIVKDGKKVSVSISIEEVEKDA